MTRSTDIWPNNQTESLFSSYMSRFSYNDILFYYEGNLKIGKYSVKNDSVHRTLTQYRFMFMLLNN